MHERDCELQRDPVRALPAAKHTVADISRVTLTQRAADSYKQFRPPAYGKGWPKMMD